MLSIHKFKTAYAVAYRAYTAPPPVYDSSQSHEVQA